jgi:hypothetical protein
MQVHASSPLEIITVPRAGAPLSERGVIRADDYPSCSIPGPCEYCGRACRIRYFYVESNGPLMCSSCLGVTHNRRREIKAERVQREASDLYFAGADLPEIAEAVGLGVEALRKRLAPEMRARDYVEMICADTAHWAGATQEQAAKVARISPSKFKRRRLSLAPKGELASIDWYIVGNKQSAKISITRKAA